jgi:hypothetical protein
MKWAPTRGEAMAEVCGSGTATFVVTDEHESMDIHIDLGLDGRGSCNGCSGLVTETGRAAHRLAGCRAGGALVRAVRVLAHRLLSSWPRLV